MRRKIITFIASVFTVLALSIVSIGSSFVPELSAQAAITKLSLKVKFVQSDARSIADMINELRTGSDAWYLNEDGSRHTCSGLTALQLEDGLEQAAMQRAAELAVSYSHTRPNGERCFNAIKDQISYNAWMGENIAYGYKSASSVNMAWREDNEDYSGQGHRRNMLGENFSYIGIGHVVYDGIDFWAEEFGSQPASGVSYSLSDGIQNVTIDADDSSIDISKFTQNDENTTDETDKSNNNDGGSNDNNGNTITDNGSNNNNTGTKTIVKTSDTLNIFDYSESMYEGDTQTIKAQTGRNSKIIFSSSDSSIVQVTNQDFDWYSLSYCADIKGIKPGTATITAFAPGDENYNDAALSFDVTVKFDDRNQRTVTFNSNGGNYITPVTYMDGIFRNAPVPLRDGYTFKGWADNLGNYITEGMKFSSDLTLTAVWEENENHDENTNENNDTNNSTTYDQGNNTSENDETSDDEKRTVTVPSRISSIKIKKSGKNKIKISWKKNESDVTYQVVVNVGKKKYSKTTRAGSITVKAKKKQKVTVRIRSIRYDTEGASIASEWSKKTKKI